MRIKLTLFFLILWTGVQIVSLAGAVVRGEQ